MDTDRVPLSQGDLKLLQEFGKGTEERARLSTAVGGVQFLRTSGKNNSRFGSIGAYETVSFQPTAEFGGIGGGSGKNASDCHTGGHCVDFYGARTGRGGVFDVGRDWYYRPVYTAQGRTHFRGDRNDWWANDTRTTHRLLVTRDAEARDPGDRTYSSLSPTNATTPVIASPRTCVPVLS